MYEFRTTKYRFNFKMCVEYCPYFAFMTLLLPCKTRAPCKGIMKYQYSQYSIFHFHSGLRTHSRPEHFKKSRPKKSREIK